MLKRSHFLIMQIDRRVDVTDTSKGIEVQFSYSVEWFEDDLDWNSRMSRYAESRFLPSSFEIHWLSIINSFVLVLLLTAFFTTLLLTAFFTALLLTAFFATFLLIAFFAVAIFNRI